jgi:putative FmdB family regulatory protein
MPTYEYDCGACGATLEFFQSMSESPKRKCPKCGKSKLTRRIGTGAGILFRGSGFYQTDYRSSSYKQGAEAEQKTSGGSAPKDAGQGGAGQGSAPKPDAAPKSAENAGDGARSKKRDKNKTSD